jgi:hypothetical protein
LNLQNPGSLDSLRFDGNSNYLENQNIGGTGRWRSSAIANEALGVPPPPVRQSAGLNSETGAVLKQALQMMVANNSLANPEGTSRVEVSMSDGATLDSSNPNRIRAGEFRIMANNEELPVAERGFVNIIFKITINGASVQLVSSSPQQGFELKLPPMVLPKLNALLMQFKDGIPESVTLTAALANGMPLPSWLKFDPETQTFSASAIPNGTPDLQIRLQASQNGQLIDGVTFTIDLP